MLMRESNYFANSSMFGSLEEPPSVEVVVACGLLSGGEGLTTVKFAGDVCKEVTRVREASGWKRTFKLEESFLACEGSKKV